MDVHIIQQHKTYLFMQNRIRRFYLGNTSYLTSATKGHTNEVFTLTVIKNSR